MRGGLDETLARMARREEALRRRGAEPAEEPGQEAAAPSAAADALGMPPGGDVGPGRPTSAPAPGPGGGDVDLSRVATGAPPDRAGGEAARLVGPTGRARALRALPAGPTTGTTGGTTTGRVDGATGGRVDGGVGTAGGTAGSAEGRREASVGRDPVAEVAEAVARVVATHPGVTVTVRVEHDGQAYPLRVGWSGGRVTVGAEAATVPPPVWPLSVKTVPAWMPGPERLTADPAARLAELIRHDPSLLGDPGDRP
ncbi:hypothetical protein [Micromonospora rubida]|uniref:hypothetical protein n=1 Tax=Micromonospora rubida TaxID=2697657 RepID=UPI001F2D9210|nr:hypothetical protein [Micromonospora rubida]